MTWNHISSAQNSVIHGDCVQILSRFPRASIGMVLTDPPYLAKYVSRDGQSIANDDQDDWLQPAFAQIFRVLQRDSFCISFYGWHQVDKFMQAWRLAGFRPVGHLVFQKPYSSKNLFLSYRHEQAYLLAKGNPPVPETPISDVQLAQGMPEEWWNRDRVPEGISRGHWHKKFSSDLCRLIDTLYQRRSKIRDLITAFRESSRNPFSRWAGN